MSHVDLNVDNVNKLISWFYEKNISKRFDMKIIDAFYNELDENIHVYFGEMTRSRYMIFRIDGKLISDVDFLEKNTISFAKRAPFQWIYSVRYMIVIMIFYCCCLEKVKITISNI